jgi:transposase
VPSGSAEAFIRRVDTLALPSQLRSLIARSSPSMLPVNRQLAYSDQVIEHFTAHEPRIQRLRTAPRIGPVTAAAFVATINDVRRFRHAHQVVSILRHHPPEADALQILGPAHRGPPR